jgi:DnaJ like chaperone protein
MPYWGKVSGVVAGLATGTPWLALLGLLLGHQFDRGFARTSASPERLEQLPNGFVCALFRTMGCLAKADGRVTEQEIRAARAVMHRLGLGPAEVRDAIEWFREGKEASFSLSGTLRQLRHDCRRHEELHGLFVRLLMEVALSKHVLHRSERAAIWTICRELDIGRVELAQIEAMLRAQQSFRSSPAGTADAERVSDAYAVLGVNRTATNAEIKQAYRRLMNRNHPDKLSGVQADAASLVAAQERTRQIRGAYDMLKARRNIR